MAPDRYNKWDNDITGTPGSRARPGPNVVIITFGSLDALPLLSTRILLPFVFPRDYANTFSSRARERTRHRNCTLVEGRPVILADYGMDNDSLHLRRRTRELFPYV